MPDSDKRLLIYEALELRSEYDAQIETLRKCLPESRNSSRASLLERADGGAYRPADGVDPTKLRREIRALEHKRHKLNAAIQAANFTNTVHVGGEEVTLAEALELRKATNTRIGELGSQLVRSAVVRVVHKEDRDIEEAPDVSFGDARRELQEAREEFRRLNRALREASHRVPVDFTDEPDQHSRAGARKT
ncbi:MAG: hypothetical protein ACLFMV_12415 [Spirochaetaceae bacterium]